MNDREAKHPAPHEHGAVITAQSDTPDTPGTPDTPAAAATRVKAKGRLFTWPLLIGVIVTAGLVVLSLFVGVYDIFGADDADDADDLDDLDDDFDDDDDDDDDEEDDEDDDGDFDDDHDEA